jgi:hypothetical protein
MTLVQKGKVTARSVLRGPTTGQFWRHAAKVKGVSREFGLCWSCGGEITKTARACPSCKRLQEPPLNPDILLESAEFSGDELAEAMWSDQTPASSQMAAPPAPRVNSPPMEKANGPLERANGSAVDRLVARGGVRREVTHPYDAPAIGTLPTRQERGFTNDATMEHLPASGPELAVFQMPPRPGEKRRRGSVVGRIVKTLFVALVLMALGVGVLCTFDEGIRHRCLGLARRGMDSVKTFFGAETPGRPLSDYKLNKTKEEDGDDAGVSAPAPEKGNGPAAPKQSTAGGASAPQVTVGPAAAGQEAPVRPTIEQKRSQMWDLWHEGTAAYDRHDYVKAVKALEAMKAFGLPEEDLPIGLDAKIAAAKRQMK